MEEHKGEFVLVSIADPSSNDPAAWVKQNPYPWTFGTGDAPAGGKAGAGPSELYKVEGVPHTFFIDRKGNIVDEAGAMDKAAFAEKLAKIL
jgi:hypothetical protein